MSSDTLAMAEVKNKKLSASKKSVSVQGISKFTLSLPPKQEAELERLSIETNLTKTDLIRQAISLLTTAVSESDKGNNIAITDSDDKVIMKIISSIF